MIFFQFMFFLLRLFSLFLLAEKFRGIKAIETHFATLQVTPLIRIISSRLHALHKNTFPLRWLNASYLRQNFPILNVSLLCYLQGHSMNSNMNYSQIKIDRSCISFTFVNYFLMSRANCQTRKMWRNYENRSNNSFYGNQTSWKVYRFIRIFETRHLRIKNLKTKKVSKVR